MYRAVYREGRTVDFLLGRSRAIFAQSDHDVETGDEADARSPANHHTIQQLKETLYLTCQLQIRTPKCLTNRIERDHRRIKQRGRVMQTFQVFRNASVTIADIELAHQFRKEKRRQLEKNQGATSA